jgi:hypothetical protein
MEIKEACEEEVISEIRMIKLLPHGISENWPDLKRCIELSLPKVGVTSDQRPERMTMILEELLAGSMEIHVFYRLIRNVPFTYALVLTSIIMSVDGTHTDLLIHCFYGHRKMITNGDLETGLGILAKYAKSKGCVSIVTYASREFYQQFLASIGFNTDFIYAVKEV